MKTIATAALAAAAAFAIAAPASAAGIERMTSPAPALILRGALVPAGSDLLFLSGQLAAPIVPGKTDSIEAYGDTRTQTISTLTKIKALLAEKGFTLSDIFKMTIFVAPDPKLGKMDFAGVNEGFRQFFGTAENPNTVARSAFQVAALAGPNFLVEIEVIAAKAK